VPALRTVLDGLTVWDKAGDPWPDEWCQDGVCRRRDNGKWDVIWGGYLHGLYDTVEAAIDGMPRWSG